MWLLVYAVGVGIGTAGAFFEAFTMPLVRVDRQRRWESLLLFLLLTVMAGILWPISWPLAAAGWLWARFGPSSFD